MTDDDSLTVAPAIDERDVYPLVRIVLLVTTGLVLLGLASIMPGLEWLLSELPIAITADAILLAAGTYLVVGALLAAAPTVERLLSRSLAGPDRVVADAAASAKYLVVFAAVLVGYRGFEPLIVDATSEWIYHGAFLLAALAVLVLVARQLHRSIDPVADLLARAVVHSIGSNATDATETPDATTERE